MKPEQTVSTKVIFGSPHTKYEFEDIKKGNIKNHVAWIYIE